MNVSPHHQRPTKYPWPGPRGAVGVLVVLVLVLVIGFFAIGWLNDNEEPEQAGISDHVWTAYGIAALLD